MKIFIVFGSAFMMMAQFQQVSVAVWQVLYCHVIVFPIVHIENEVTLGHNETCTNKRQNWESQFTEKKKKKYYLK